VTQGGLLVAAMAAATAAAAAIAAAAATAFNCLARAACLRSVLGLTGALVARRLAGPD